MGHTSDALSDKGVIGVGARSHRIKPRVERVAGGGTHGGRLKTAPEEHAFLDQSAQMRGLGLPSVNLQIRKSTIISHDEENIQGACFSCVSDVVLGATCAQWQGESDKEHHDGQWVRGD